MKILFMQILIKAFWFTVILLFVSIKGYTKDYFQGCGEKFSQLASHYLNSNRDSAVICHKLAINCFLTEGEINKVLNEKLKYASVLSSNGEYSEAYDQLWDVLILSDSMETPIFAILDAYKQLGMLYAIFDHYEKSMSCIEHIDSLVSGNDTIPVSKQLVILYNSAIIYRMFNDLENATYYFDKYEKLSIKHGIQLENNYYYLSQRANLFTLMGKYQEAEEILERIEQIPSVELNYWPIIYSFKGDLYHKKGELQKGLFYYNRCLEIINKHNLRLGLKVEVLEKMSSINENLGNYKLAYEQINESNKLGNTLFESKSAKIRKLFEIKDNYRRAITEKEEIIKEQRLGGLEKDRQTLKFKVYIYSILMILVLISSSIVVVSIRRKHIAEKWLVYERNAKDMEIKKKELAITALKLMGKDALLDELKNGIDRVKKEDNILLLDQLKSTIKSNSSASWDEFEARFLQINTSFYDSLKQQNPELSPNELKLCALIKLNFTSKEIAKFLSITTDSVNKARYRLRKKLNIKPEVNLTSYISNL